jgi:hypothetical protein
MDMDTAKAMLTLLLGKKWPLFPNFHQYLDVSMTLVLEQCYMNVQNFGALHPADF